MKPSSLDAARAGAEVPVDARALEALKRDAGRDPRAAIGKAAQQFEALFMQMVLKSMREATPKSGLLDSAAGELYTGMLDQQLAGKVAAGGTGLADMIVRQLTRHLRPAAAAAGEGQEATARREPSAAISRAWRAAARGAAGAGAAAIDAKPAAGEVTPRPAAEGRAAPTGRDFVAAMWEHAASAERATGVPAKFILGQAALESGWGRREIRHADGSPSHNLFGIKAGANWKGRTVETVTTEFENGVPRKVVERFRAYDSYAEAFADWARLISTQPRYAGVLAESRGGSAHGFATAMQRAGYATDPAYGAKLTQVINTTLALLRSTA